MPCVPTALHAIVHTWCIAEDADITLSQSSPSSRSVRTFMPG